MRICEINTQKKYILQNTPRSGRIWNVLIVYRNIGTTTILTIGISLSQQLENLKESSVIKESKKLCYQINM